MKVSVQTACLPNCPCRDRPRLGPRLNENYRISDAINSVLSQSVEKAIPKGSSLCFDVRNNDLNGMTQIRHAFLSGMFPRELDYIIAGKRQISHSYAWRVQKSVQFVGLSNNLDPRSIVPLGQISPH